MYKPLVMKTAVDASNGSIAKKNLYMFVNWWNLLTLTCMMPMLHFVNCLIKFAQSPTCYIVNFISMLNI